MKAKTVRSALCFLSPGILLAAAAHRHRALLGGAPCLSQGCTAGAARSLSLSMSLSLSLLGAPAPPGTDREGEGSWRLPSRHSLTNCTIWLKEWSTRFLGGCARSDPDTGTFHGCSGLCSHVGCPRPTRVLPRHRGAQRLEDVTASRRHPASGFISLRTSIARPGTASAWAHASLSVMCPWPRHAHLRCLPAQTWSQGPKT